MPRIAADRLHRFVVACCRAGGSEEGEAVLVADHLVRANLTGHDSHGVGMLPDYAASVKSGALVANAHAAVTTDTGAVLAIDGRRGYGQVVAKEAMDLGIERARELGACVVALRNAHHIGRIGHWSEQCAASGLASVHFVNVVDHAPWVATFGGADARLGTNPFSAALPGDDGPAVLLDMATSKIALGKARVAMNKGAEVPEGSVVDPEGRPTRDPNVMFGDRVGALLPFGEHKGSGLAVLCELFAGVLTGGVSIHPDNPRKGGIVNNMLSILIDPGRLVSGDHLRDESGKLRDYIKAARPTGDGAPLLPGEPERRTAEERARDGIPVDDGTWRAARGAALAFGVVDTAIDRLLTPL